MSDVVLSSSGNRVQYRPSARRRRRNCDSGGDNFDGKESSSKLDNKESQHKKLQFKKNSGRNSRRTPARSQFRSSFHDAFNGGELSDGFHINSAVHLPKEGLELPKGSMKSTTNNTSSFGEHHEELQTLQQQQRVEDFMDERDHNEWGGPSSIRQEYATLTKQEIPKVANNKGDAGDNLIGNIMNIDVRSHNIGYNLLRQWGWREGRETGDGASLYVPQQNGQQNQQQQKQQLFAISEKKITKIKLHNNAIKIPAPKLDSCGLGYEKYENAPEFLEHKQRRKRIAKEKAYHYLNQNRSSSNNNTYSISNVITNNDGTNLNGDSDSDDNRNKQKRKQKRSNKHNNSEQKTNFEDDDDPHATLETVEDFVGTKSSGGFALRDDDDDAYDNDDYNNQPSLMESISNNQKHNEKRKIRIDRNAFCDTVYEHSSSGEDNDRNEYNLPPKKETKPTLQPSTSNGKKKMKDIIGALSSWANNDSSIESNDNDNKGSASATVTGVTNDGSPPLNGFVLGGSNFITCTDHDTKVDKYRLMNNQRYQGPGIPCNYQLERHVFQKNETPLTFKALSRASQLLETILDNNDEYKKSDGHNQPRERHLHYPGTATKTAQKPYQQRQQQQQQQGQINDRSKMTSLTNSNAFSVLAEAMKNRFTKSSSNDDTTFQTGGIHSSAGNRDVERVPSMSSSKKLSAEVHTSNINKRQDRGKEYEHEYIDPQISRTVISFTPSLLLCKRFSVHPPIHARSDTNDANNNNMSGNNIQQTPGSAESSYFQDIVRLGQQNINQDNSDMKDKNIKGGRGIIKNMNVGLNDDDIRSPLEERPAMAIYKSVFQQNLNDIDDDEDSGVNKVDHAIVNPISTNEITQDTAIIIKEKSGQTQESSSVANRSNNEILDKSECCNDRCVDSSIRVSSPSIASSKISLNDTYSVDEDQPKKRRGQKRNKRKRKQQRSNTTWSSDSSAITSDHDEYDCSDHVVKHDNRYSHKRRTKTSSRRSRQEQQKSIHRKRRGDERERNSSSDSSYLSSDDNSENNLVEENKRRKRHKKRRKASKHRRRHEKEHDSERKHKNRSYECEKKGKRSKKHRRK